ncbi:coiled-coil domain-containing protein 124-like [Actinia tenebrosa]|uniref:Coiled-coil domain-containing protein 124-like n=1 Tax=Actinia tenebrosa TaxID=6105 RepID=A0A6P8J1B4_ACTTE|nr:coiled-coil domain-containing protein 124-like [Actinia tenebrosa]
MPKKFKGVNTKAEEARSRKLEAKAAEKEKKEREEEDKLWEDDSKHVAKKLQRKDEKEQKRLAALEKKAQARQLLEEEEKSLKGKTKAPPSQKVTRAQITAEKEKEALAAKGKQNGEQKTTIHDEPLEENPNQKMAELLAAEGAVEARSVEEAIATLSVDSKVEKHPEKRMKASYLEFESRELPRLKQENPNLRLSQLKQILKKDWMKSPENPMNAAHIAYNAKVL